MSKGIIYVFHGSSYVKEALISAESVKKHCPDIHITAFTDVDIESEFIDSVKKIKPTSVRSKVYYIYDSPYDETIFLDTDVIVDYPIHDMFDLLKKYDLGIVHDLARKRKKYSDIIPEYGEIPYAFSEVNTGIMVFKKCEVVRKLFKLWGKYHKKYYKLCPYDQPSFRISFLFL